MSQLFTYESHQVRTVTEKGETWFAARDVCAALGIGWTGATLKNIPVSWQGLLSFNIPSTGKRGGGNQRLKVISEAAVYKLAFRSNKPEADAFTNWVASEVLPAIRKTGRYKAGPASRQECPCKTLPTTAAVLDERAQKVQSLVSDVKERGNEFMSSVFTLYNALRLRPVVLDPLVPDLARALEHNLPQFCTAIGMNVSALSDMLEVYGATLKAAK